MTYCHSSWEFLNELKWGIFIPVLYSLTIWLASLLKCITGDRAHVESAAPEQQVSIYTPKHNKPAATTSKPRRRKKNKRKEKETWLPLLPPFSATLLSSHNNEIPRCVPACVLGQVLQFKERYPCFFFRNGPMFSVSQRKKPDAFLTADMWLSSKVYEVRTGCEISSREDQRKIQI